jgi:hypothetical protein
MTMAVGARTLAELTSGTPQVVKESGDPVYYQSVKGKSAPGNN